MNANSLQDRTVGELAVEMPVSIRVFEAWKIDYCCGGMTPVAEACSAAGKTVEELAQALASAVVIPEGVTRDWAAEPIADIAAHIVATYHEYTREELATVLPLAAKVHSVHGHRRPELVEVEQLVVTLTDDLLPHMLKEEQVLFPYVGQLALAADGGKAAPTPFFGTVKNPVRMMMLEHDRVGEILARLREISDGFTPPDSACFSYRELYRRLAELELRTHEHVHLENNVYFPRAIALEDSVGKPDASVKHDACGCNH
jgi:regulator of cell morphogenesis and NO signaling